MKATRTRAWTRRSASPARHAACAGVQRQVCARKPRAVLRRASTPSAARSFGTGEQPVGGASRARARATKASSRTSSARQGPRRPGVNRHSPIQHNHAFCKVRAVATLALRLVHAPLHFVPRPSGSQKGWLCLAPPPVAAHAMRSQRVLELQVSVLVCCAHQHTGSRAPAHPAGRSRARKACARLRPAPIHPRKRGLP